MHILHNILYFRFWEERLMYWFYTWWRVLHVYVFVCICVVVCAQFIVKQHFNLSLKAIFLTANQICLVILRDCSWRVSLYFKTIQENKIQIDKNNIFLLYSIYFKQKKFCSVGVSSLKTTWKNILTLLKTL